MGLFKSGPILSALKSFSEPPYDFLILRNDFNMISSKYIQGQQI